MNDIYDSKGWCGLPEIWTTSQNDSLNRACAGHDMSIENNLYSEERLDELFYERIEIYAKQEEGLWRREIKPKIYKNLVKAYRRVLDFFLTTRWVKNILTRDDI